MFIKLNLFSNMDINFSTPFKVKEVADKIYKEIVAKRMSFREEMKKAREEAKYLTQNDLHLLREQTYLCRKNIISFEEAIQNRKKIIEQAKQRKQGTA